jgi:hypothetical protein
VKIGPGTKFEVGRRSSDPDRSSTSSTSTSRCLRAPTGPYAVRDVSFSVNAGEIRLPARRIGIRQVDHRADGDGTAAVQHPRDRAGLSTLLGENVLAYTPAQLRASEGVRMSMVFQEPMTAPESGDDVRDAGRRDADAAHALDADRRREADPRHLRAGEAARSAADVCELSAPAVGRASGSGS